MLEQMASFGGEKPMIVIEEKFFLNISDVFFPDLMKEIGDESLNTKQFSLSNAKENRWR